MYHSCDYDKEFCMGHGFSECGTCGRNVKLYMDSLIDYSRMKIIDPTITKKTSAYPTTPIDEDGKPVIKKSIDSTSAVSSKCAKYEERY